MAFYGLKISMIPFFVRGCLRLLSITFHQRKKTCCQFIPAEQLEISRKPLTTKRHCKLPFFCFLTGRNGRIKGDHSGNIDDFPQQCKGMLPLLPFLIGTQHSIVGQHIGPVVADESQVKKLAPLRGKCSRLVRFLVFSHPLPWLVHTDEFNNLKRLTWE